MYGMVKRIDLFNVYHAKHGSYIIWSVGIVDVENLQTDNDVRCFVIYRLSQKEIEYIPEQNETEMTTQYVQCASNFILWEYDLRLKHPLLGPLCSQIGRVIYHLKIDQNILTAACPQRLVQCEDYSGLRFGALICETILKKSSIEGTLDVEQLDLFLKTKQGIYQFFSGDTDSRLKRTKIESELDILDIFKPCSYSLQLGDANVDLCVPKAAVDVLIINHESIWNRALIIFFRALYRKIYGAHTGLKPCLHYVFPGYFKNGSIFAPYFSSFPFVSMQFTRDMTTVDKKLLISDQLIVLDVAHASGKTSINNQILMDFVFKVPKQLQNNIGLSWPLWNSELNSQICDTDGRGIHIRKPHCFIKLTFTLKCIADDYSPHSMEILDMYSTGRLKAHLTNFYNHIVYCIMHWCHKNNFIWVAFYKNQVCIASQKVLDLPAVSRNSSKQTYPGKF
ncbi:helicase-primase complex component [Porcine lymphotropic herpesvirus 3]|uniref:Helicase-primase complex component n=1 Tax=Suid gammaherpesvirus 5 TaxID=1960251 RepID=Q8B3Y2_9GAMA|nr:helicase-primase complex component [Porcine lymphotropic herpesvirus 3]AAO12343.1 helicase-primase complex component [Porcine lymphotropic herpesvirus 3]